MANGDEGTTTTQPTLESAGIVKKEKPLTPRQQCKLDGGKWINGKCVFIQPEPEPKLEIQPPKAPPTQEIFRDAGTGEATGITLEDGRTFGGLDPRDIALIEKQQAEKKAKLPQSPQVGTAQAEATEQFRTQQSISQLGNVDPNTLALENIQQADIDWGQAWTAGTVGAAPSIIQSIATGALSGAFVGSKIGAIGGVGGAIALGAVGAAVGIWRGVQGNIKTQQQGEIGATSADLQAGQLKMRQYAMAASRDPYHVDKYVQLYNNEKAKLYISRRQLQTEVSGNLNKWMDDGRVQMAKYDDYLEVNGIADIYENKLRISLQMGVPLMPEDLE